MPLGLTRGLTRPSRTRTGLAISAPGWPHMSSDLIRGSSAAMTKCGYLILNLFFTASRNRKMRTALIGN